MVVKAADFVKKAKNDKDKKSPKASLLDWIGKRRGKENKDDGKE